jgi:hypothetical protein
MEIISSESICIMAPSNWGLLTIESMFHSSLSGICGRLTGLGTGFSWSTLVSTGHLLFCECFLSVCFTYDVCIRPDQPTLYHSSLLIWGLCSDAACDCSRSFLIESMSLIHYHYRSWPQKTDCWRHYRKDRPLLSADMKAQKQYCLSLFVHIMKKFVFWQLT